MFIKLDEYVIPIDNICYIKLVGSGANVYIKTQIDPIKIAYVSDTEKEIALDKLFLRRKEMK